ncbi:hypothetical protein EV652_102370 [Kribbella steppae]|uniref:Uncharacterized protein n=1 Tax=Kribbella steppae TaxID=2512223 RepID=A0A4R2HSN2_9ACTN|nr:hypothetical protein EV652_102370 [Kribbella steppae]
MKLYLMREEERLVWVAALAFWRAGAKPLDAGAGGFSP